MPLFYPRAKERGQNNQPLLCRAEHGLHFDSAVCTPDVCGIWFTCQTTQPKRWLCPWSLFWPIAKSGEKQEERESPKGLSLASPPQTQCDLSGRADRYFSSVTAFCCEIHMFKDMYQFRWLLSKIITISHFWKPEHSALPLPAFTVHCNEASQKEKSS